MADQESFSWRSEPNVLFPVKKLRKNICWAAVGSEAITSQYQTCHREGSQTALSMQEILNCVKRRDGARDEDIKRQRFEAYQTIRVFDYAKARGLTLRSEYPYIHDCITCRPPLQATRIFVTSYDSRTLLPDHELGADQVQKQKREVDDIIKGFPVVGLMSLHYPSFEEYGEIGQGAYKGKSTTDRYIGEHAVLLTGFDKEEDGTEVFEFKNTSGLAFGDQGFGKLKRDLIFSISYPKGVLKVDKIDKDGIGHKYIMVRGLQIHVAEIGTGSSVVLFCYGFPEMWYSWRYQMLAVANKGFRAIVPDYQGYGVSEMPQEPEKTTFLLLVNDLFAVLRNMGISKVFLVAKGFGVQIASLFAIRHQEMVNGIITIGPPSIPGTQFSPFQNLSPKCYLSRWKDPQKAKDEFNCFDPKAIVRKIYILFSQDEIPEICDDENSLDLIDDSLCPSWITEDDLTFYGTWYERTGFSTALKLPFRSLDENVKIVNQQIRVPALMIIAGKDHFLKFPSIHDYIQSERVNRFVPDLEMKYLPEGTHFVQEQLPDDVNEAILTFMSKHSQL